MVRILNWEFWRARWPADLYAVTTGIYSLSSVMITYEMSRKIANTSWIQLAFSAALVLGICALSSESARGHLRAAGADDYSVHRGRAASVAQVKLSRPMTSELSRSRLHAPLSEHQVIAEFLRSEFHHPEFEEYR